VTTVTTQEGPKFAVAEIQVVDVKRAIEAWGLLPEDGRVALRDLALELRNSTLVAGTHTAEAARDIWEKVIEPQITKLPPAAAEYLASIKQHTWDDRTWAQRLAVASLIATFPITGGKAAGLAMLGTAFRVAIPVLGAAAGALVGSGLDLVSSTVRRINGSTAEDSEVRPAMDVSQIRITYDPEVHGGRPCIRGQVPIKDILDHFALGAGRSEILRIYPNLDDADITAALKFASGAMNLPMSVIDFGPQTS